MAKFTKARKSSRPHWVNKKRYKFDQKGRKGTTSFKPSEISQIDEDAEEENVFLDDKREMKTASASSIINQENRLSLPLNNVTPNHKVLEKINETYDSMRKGSRKRKRSFNGENMLQLNSLYQTRLTESEYDGQNEHFEAHTFGQKKAKNNHSSFSSGREYQFSDPHNTSNTSAIFSSWRANEIPARTSSSVVTSEHENAFSPSPLSFLSELKQGTDPSSEAFHWHNQPLTLEERKPISTAMETDSLMYAPSKDIWKSDEHQGNNIWLSQMDDELQFSKQYTPSHSSRRTTGIPFLDENSHPEWRIGESNSRTYESEFVRIKSEPLD